MSAAFAKPYFVENTDKHQLIRSHLHQWTTNPISKHHYYADRGMKIRASGINNREQNLGTRRTDKQVGVLRGQTAGEKDALFICVRKHTCPLSA